MRIPFVQLDGFRPRPRFYSEYMDEARREVEARLLARIVKFGASDGLEVTSATTALVTGVNVSSGLAYDAYGRRVPLAAVTFLALDNTDDGKYVVLSRTQVSSHIEFHPITGVSAYTKVEDSSVLSAVVSPNENLGHVRLALIQDVRDFPLPVDLRVVPIVDRDVLLASSPFPYVTVGPTGDSSVEFAGDDETPFLDAIDALGITSGGILYVKRNVYDLSAGIDISGLRGVTIVGEGKGTSFRGTAPFFRCSDLDSLSIEGVSMSSTNSDEGMVSVVRIPVVSMEDCYVTGNAAGSYALALVSGIESLRVRGNMLLGDVFPWKAVGTADVAVIEQIMFKRNFASGGGLQFSQQIDELEILSNWMDDVDVDEETLPA